MRPEVHTTPTNHANRLLRPGRLARSRLRLSVRRFAAAARADGHYDPPGCDLGRLLHHRRSLGASGPWSFEGGERQPIATAAARDARQDVLGVGQGVHGTHGGGWAGCHSGRRGWRAVGAAGNSCLGCCFCICTRIWRQNRVPDCRGFISCAPHRPASRRPARPRKAFIACPEATARSARPSGGRPVRAPPTGTGWHAGRVPVGARGGRA